MKKISGGFTTHRLKTAETLGERLRTAREEANLTLKEVSQSIRVREIYLKLLEEGKYNELPPDVYIKGFLKSYCNYIGIDYNLTLGIYRRERGIQENIDKSKQKKPLTPMGSSFPVVITPRLIKIGGAIIVLLALVLYIWFQLSGLSRPPSLTILDPADDRTVNDDVIVLVGETDPETEITINDQPIQVDNSGQFKETIILQEGLNVLKIIANNRFGKVSEIKRNVMVELSGDLERQKESEKLALGGKKEKKEGGAEDEKNKKKKDDLNLVITVQEKTSWIQVKSDDRLIYSGMMLPDASQTFKAKDKFNVSSGNPDKTKIILNGKDLGILGSGEEMVRDKEIKP